MRRRRLRRSSTRIYRAIDGAMGGNRPPTRRHRFAARHPLRFGLAAGALATAAFAMTWHAGEAPSSDLVVVPVGGIAMGTVFWLTARMERARQRHLRRRGARSRSAG